MNTMPKPTKNKQDGSTKANSLVQSLLRGEIDGRTATAKGFMAARSIVEQDHTQLAQSLLKDQLSAWALAQSLIVSEVVKSKSLLEDGQLSPLFGELQRCEQSVLKIHKALQSLDDRAATDKGKGGLGMTDFFDVEEA